MKNIVLCACKKGNKIDQSAVTKWQTALEAKNIAYTLVEDLCGSVANKDPEIKQIDKSEKTIVIGCQEKAMKNLLAKANITKPENYFEFKHAEKTTVELLDEIDAIEGTALTIAYDSDWKPWFPVLDYELCTSCQKCLNFCLFGVYSLNDDGEVLVENPSNCKDLCPACARTCPTQAIVFPKHHESPIDGGEGKLEVLNAKDLITQIQQSQDVYKLLADRRKASGISLLKVDQLKLAQEERDACKNKE